MEARFLHPDKEYTTHIHTRHLSRGTSLTNSSSNAANSSPAYLLYLVMGNQSRRGEGVSRDRRTTGRASVQPMNSSRP